MIEIVTKGGKKIGQLADDMNSEDSLFIHGKKIPLEDAYSSDQIKQSFNDQVKELKGELSDKDTRGNQE